MSKFKIFTIIGSIWGAMFAVMLITESRFLARGVLPCISAIITMWFAYWTISEIRGNKVVEKVVDRVRGNKVVEKVETNGKSKKSSSKK